MLAMYQSNVWVVNGLKGREIPIGARVLTVADAFDAITSDREYRPAQSYEYAMTELANCSGTQFDPEVVEAFQKAGQKRKEQWPLSAQNTKTSANHNGVIVDKAWTGGHTALINDMFDVQPRKRQ